MGGMGDAVAVRSAKARRGLCRGEGCTGGGEGRPGPPLSSAGALGAASQPPSAPSCWGQSHVGRGLRACHAVKSRPRGPSQPFLGKRSVKVARLRVDGDARGHNKAGWQHRALWGEEGAAGQA